MQEAVNPEGNALKAGVTIENLTRAIERSGYPLQATVFELLKNDFFIQQEWGFRDRLTGDMRAIDLLATRDLNHRPALESRVRPTLRILIECKQSEMPYIFFSPTRGAGQHRLPQLCGLREDKVIIKTDDDRSSWHFSSMHALGLTEEDFFKTHGYSIMSKCTRKGKELELSGTDAYNGIVMPLMSAAAHFAEASKPSERAHWFDVYLVCAVAVVDAPMVAAVSGPEGIELEMRPWCRLFRHEPDRPGAFMGHMGISSAIDVVHKDFFREYLQNHLLPFANEFSKRALRNDEVLATGKAFAQGFRADSSAGIEGRLQPRD
ncbi:hypothetical protein ABZX95_15975 [Streptomyces sp. NPDC004232]|uniref:hypothetical protein n=1 Tax=Streptomyces sp. NPDC004232 TaxID=3154454 RepID=UPI001D43105E|nr:hypothetical protein [Streptomyces sp. tea 10]